MPRRDVVEHVVSGPHAALAGGGDAGLDTLDLPGIRLQSRSRSDGIV